MEKLSLILETENLGMAELADLDTSLTSIKYQDYPINNIFEVLVVIGSKVTPKVQGFIKKHYPWVRLHTVNGSLDYAKSKMEGAKAAKGNILVFCDSDVSYEKTWLRNMVNAFKKYPEGVVMSGDTRLTTISSYHMALNATWMIQILSEKINGLVPQHFFPLNNFAIRRQDMMNNPPPYTLPLYRNKIPIWEKVLTNAGLKIMRVPGTRGFHAPPGKLIDWFYRMLIYGADFVALADFSLSKSSEVIEKINVAGRLFQLIILGPWKLKELVVNTIKLMGEDISRVKYLPGALIISVANISVMLLGALIAFFNRDFLFNKINAHEANHNV